MLSFFRYLLFFAFVLLTVKVNGQSRVLDSLLQVLPQTTDTSRFVTLSKLFWTTFNTDPHQAKKYLDEERILARELGLELFIGRSYNDLGVYYWTQSNLDSSILSFQKALSIFEKVGERHRQNATMNNLGNLFADKADYEKALDYYMGSVKIKEELNDTEGLMSTYTNVANMYLETDYPDLALEYYNKSLDIALDLNDSSMFPQCYNGIGAVHYNKKNYRESVIFRKKGLDFSRKANNKYSEALSLENLSQSYYKLGLYDSSLLLLKGAQKINSELGNRHALSINYRSIAQNYKEKKMYSLAMESIIKGLDIASEIEAMRDVMHDYRVLSEIYEQQGNYARGLEHYKKYISIKDSIFSEETKLKINDLEIKYQTEKKEKELAQKNLEIEELHEAALLQEFRRKWLVAGLLAAVVLSGFIYYSQKQRMKRQRLESEKQQLEMENELALRKKELTSHTLHLVQKNELLDEINLKLKELKKSTDARPKEITRLIQRIKNDKISDKDWDNFKMYFDQVHEDFDTKLKQYFNDLTSSEIRLATLMKMKLSTKEIASILNISPDSVNKARYRLRKKLNMNTDDRLEDFILAL